jgi:hypothetical protein
LGDLQVIDAEGLIGLKLQVLVNHRSRARDIEDIRARLCMRRGRLNVSESRAYVAMFDLAQMLDGLLAEIAD